MQFNGFAIRALRRRSNLNVSALAAAAGIRQPHMSLIEAGKRQPSDEVAMRIAAALGCDDLRAIVVTPGPDPIPVDSVVAA
jgi:transcriptional regulator with XRE-family HTH domain